MEDQTLNPYRAAKSGETALQVEPSAAARPLSVRLLRDLAISAGLALLVLVSYWGVWNFDFIYFDDPGYISENLDVTKGLPLFKNPAVFCDNVKWAFTAFVQSNWHPLTWLSHMLDVQLYGLGAGGHHVTNIIIHSCNVLLLFWLLRVMTGRVWPCAVVAALFAVHPMHVESVVWVAERKDVLSTFFGLMTLLVYVFYARRAAFKPDLMLLIAALAAFSFIFTLMCLNSFGNLRPETLPVSMLWIFPLIFLAAGVYAIATGHWYLILYCGVFLLFVVGLLAKPMLVTLPAVCLLLDFWPLKRINFRRAAAPPPVPARVLIDRTAAPRRKAKRNQRLPSAGRRGPPAEGRGGNPIVRKAAQILVEKLPLFNLAAISAIITPYAQNHGGSMASTGDLSLGFRLENSTQSYLRYLTRMFWPGRMTTLYLLDVEHVDHLYTAAAVVTLLAISALVVWSVFKGRRYLAFGWLWYLGILVPVIGLVQVGEQTHADRYTYIPYVGLFIMLAWGVTDLMKHAGSLRPVLKFFAGFAMTVILVICVGWSKYQLQFWTDPEAHMRHALTIEPDSWNMLNNLGVFLWKRGQERDRKAADFEANGDMAAAAELHKAALASKDDAMEQWLHGIKARPTATDICSNLGYAYSERNDLDKAEYYLRRAVELKDISPRPHNNLGRVLLRRSQNKETDALAAEAKGKTDPAEAAKVKSARDDANALRDAAIAQFERAVDLDPSLLEARLNLGQVFLDMGHRALAEKNREAAEAYLKKSEEQYRAILKFDSISVKDPEQISNFSQAYFNLGHIALARGKPDDAIAAFKAAVARKPENLDATRFMIVQLYQRDDFHEGDKYVWQMFAHLPAPMRRSKAEEFCKQCAGLGSQLRAVRAFDITAWLFATSPLPALRDPQAALGLATHVVQVTQQKDPLAIDTYAAALAANGQFPLAVKAAQAAINMANSQGNKELAEMIAKRLPSYEGSTLYISDPVGSDRP